MSPITPSCVLCFCVCVQKHCTQGDTSGATSITLTTDTAMRCMSACLPTFVNFLAELYQPASQRWYKVNNFVACCDAFVPFQRTIVKHKTHHRVELRFYVPACTAAASSGGMQENACRCLKANGAGISAASICQEREREWWMYRRCSFTS